MASAVGEQFAPLMALNGNRVIGNVGDGAFIYEGLQSWSDPGLTVWRFRAYGGLKLTGDPHAPDELPTTVWATTSKSPALLDAAFPQA